LVKITEMKKLTYRKNKIMKTLTLLAGLLLSLGMAAQSHGEIFGKIIDENNNPVAGVIVRAENNGIVVGAATDERGIYRINGVEPGTYTVIYDLIGYSQLQVANVEVKSDQIRKLSDYTLATASYGTGGPVIIRAEKPLIDINGGTAISLGASELKNNAAANGGSLKAILTSMSSDIKTSDRGEELYFRGSRSGSVVYIIDGVKIYGSPLNIPSSGIGNITVYTGGVPAKYGDSTGGYVIIDTKSYRDAAREKK
jgi:hypothetical protein